MNFLKIRKGVNKLSLRLLDVGNRKKRKFNRKIKGIVENNKKH